MSNSVNVNYDGLPGGINCTVLPREMQISKDDERKKLAAHVAANEEYRRVKRGKRTMKHVLKEDAYANGADTKITTTTTTTRKDK